MIIHQHAVPAKPERVLILGAHGFIAQHLRDWCTANKIDCLAVGSSELDLGEVANAPRLAAILRPGDAVVMTSALTPEKGRDALTLMRNLRMAETVCRALSEAQCAHFVYLSSDAVYDAQKLPLDEDSSREPTDMYALCHTAREMMLGAELARLAIPLCILRPSAVYGQGDTHNAYGPNRFVRSAINIGRIELFGEGEEQRSHIFIDDIIALMGLTLLHRSAGTLNIAVEPSMSFNKIALKIASICDKPIPLEHIPRTTPISHRSFTNRSVFDTFPNFCFTPIETGLASFIAAEQIKAGRSDSVPKAMAVK